MIKYVCGFYFSFNMEYVTLILKNKPEWQKDKLNGVGGKIEPNENINDAMVREMKEETDIDTNSRNWINLVKKIEHGEDWVCYFLCTTGEEIPQTMESETVARYKVSEIINLPVIENLKHIIPYAISELKRINQEPGIIFDKKNEQGIPDSNIEYILTYDVPGNITTTKHSIPKGTVVNNVYLKNQFYYFTVKNTGIEEHTFYPWALAEATEENLKRIVEYETSLIHIKEATEKSDKLYKEIKTLKISE